MPEKIKCSRCKHRLPRMICGCPESEYYNHKIEHTTYCEHFVNNPAQDHYSKALVSTAFLEESEQHEQKAKEMIAELKEALKIGLPKDDQVRAKFMLGGTYYALLRHKARQAWPMSQELKRAIEEMEAAVIIDSQEGYKYFLEPINSARLQTLAAVYVAVSQQTQEEQGTDSAIAYVKQKLELFNYLPGPPSLLLLNLGELYESKGQTANARTIFMKVLERAENPVDDIDSDVRRSARSRIQETKSGEKKQSGCFIATAVYGNENSLEVEILRRFRDHIFVRSYTGRAFITFYYLVSPSIARVVKASGLAKKVVRAVLLRPALWLSANLQEIRKGNSE